MLKQWCGRDTVVNALRLGRSILMKNTSRSKNATAARRLGAQLLPWTEDRFCYDAEATRTRVKYLYYVISDIVTEGRRSLEEALCKEITAEVHPVQPRRQKQQRQHQRSTSLAKNLAIGGNITCAPEVKVLNRNCSVS